VELLYGTLKTEVEAGLVLPDWTENIYPEEIRPLAERSYTLFTETNLMKRIKGGAFLTEILIKMQNKRKRNLNPDRKIFLYSGHDVTLVNVMNSLGILDQTTKLPEYASALAFELHHSKSFSDGDFEVKVGSCNIIMYIWDFKYVAYVFCSWFTITTAKTNSPRS